MKLKIATLSCLHCSVKALAVVDDDGESIIITANKCHDSWKLVDLYETDIPDEFLAGAAERKDEAKRRKKTSRKRA